MEKLFRKLFSKCLISHSHDTPSSVYRVYSIKKGDCFQYRVKERCLAQFIKVFNGFIIFNRFRKGPLKPERPERIKIDPGKIGNPKYYFFVGVFIAALVIYFKPEWVIIDPICTFIFGILVLLTTIKILKDTVSVLLEATPPGVDYQVIIEHSFKGTVSVVSTDSPSKIVSYIYQKLFFLFILC